MIGRASHGKDQNVLLVTLGIAIVIENLALYFFRADTRTVETPITYEMLDIGFALVPYPRAIGFVAALAVAGVLWWLIERTDLGRAIRAVARERQGARLVGIDVDHIFAMSFGIGTAVLGAAACLLLPSFYVTPAWATCSSSSLSRSWFWAEWDRSRVRW